MKKKAPITKQVRDAKTGEFVPKEQAKKRPATTVTETNPQEVPKNNKGKKAD